MRVVRAKGLDKPLLSHQIQVMESNLGTLSGLLHRQTQPSDRMLRFMKDMVQQVEKVQAAGIARIRFNELRAGPRPSIKNA